MRPKVFLFICAPPTRWQSAAEAAESARRRVGGSPIFCRQDVDATADFRRARPKKERQSAAEATSFDAPTRPTPTVGRSRERKFVGSQSEAVAVSRKRKTGENVSTSRFFLFRAFSFSSSPLCRLQETLLPKLPSLPELSAAVASATLLPSLNCIFNCLPLE